MFVIGQFAVFGLILFAPRNPELLPEWSGILITISSCSGMILLACGFLLAAGGGLKLGRNISPLITLKAESPLRMSGAYSIVRHPIYAGILLMAFGWGFMIHGILTLFYSLLLMLIFDRKLRREEIFLIAKFSEYGEYSRRVKRLIPFIY